MRREFGLETSEHDVEALQLHCSLAWTVDKGMTLPDNCQENKRKKQQTTNDWRDKHWGFAWGKELKIDEEMFYFLSPF